MGDEDTIGIPKRYVPYVERESAAVVEYRRYCQERGICPGTGRKKKAKTA